jgi:hypothetical protein
LSRRNTKYVGMIILLLGTLLGGGFLSSSAAAQEEDPGFIRSLGTDSAPVENDYYFEASFDNSLARRHWVYFYGEGVFTLGKDWGLEVDFPNLYTQFPLGQVPLTLEPIGLMARYEAWHFGTWNDETAGAFSISAGGFYGFQNSQFPWIGSSWCVEALGGYRIGRFFLQGDYSYQGALEANVPNQFYLDTSLGYRLTPEWFLQVEADFTGISGPFSGTSWSYVPQVAFQPGDWLFELGESLGDSNLVFTELMVGRAF